MGPHCTIVWCNPRVSGGVIDVKAIYEQIVAESVDKRQQGTRYERAVKWFLENDPAWSSRLDGVWLWADSPTNGGR